MVGGDTLLANCPCQNHSLKVEEYEIPDHVFLQQNIYWVDARGRQIA